MQKWCNYYEHQMKSHFEWNEKITQLFKVNLEKNLD